VYNYDVIAYVLYYLLHNDKLLLLNISHNQLHFLLLIFNSTLNAIVVEYLSDVGIRDTLVFFIPFCDGTVGNLGFYSAYTHSKAPSHSWNSKNLILPIELSFTHF